MKDFNNKHAIVIIFLILSLFTVSLLTKYYGSVDIQEYAGSAIFFAGKYHSDLRTSHSATYGFLHSPLIKIFNSLDTMKVTSVIFLLLIILSVFFISNSKKAFWLILTSPIIWYMGPWINPIQISSLIFLWGFFFMKKFEDNGRILNLTLSGILIGASTIFWNSVLYPFLILAFVYFFNKKVKYLILFFISFLIGLSPLLIFDQIIYGAFFYSTVKAFLSNISLVLYNGIYQGRDLRTVFFIDYLIFLIMAPAFSYLIFKKDNFINNKKESLFIAFSFLFFLTNPQIRYLLFLYPIIVIFISEKLSYKQFKLQLIIFVVLSLLVTFPYASQFKCSSTAPEFSSFIKNAGQFKLICPDKFTALKNDLDLLSKDYPKSDFIIGPSNDDNTKLSFVYLKDDLNKFVSLEDYNLYLKNQTTIFKKRFESNPIINERRTIWIEGGINKNEGLDKNYSQINLAISTDGPLNLEGFEFVKQYGSLGLYKKSVSSKNYDSINSSKIKQ